MNRVAMVSRLVAAALTAVVATWPAEAARAHGASSWNDDEGARHRHHRHHDREERRHDRRDHRHRIEPGHARPIVVVPRPHLRHAPPPRVVYIAPPGRHHHRRVAAHPVSPVYLVGGGQYCRDYRASIVIAGVVRIGSCTACLHRDGVWRVID